MHSVVSKHHMGGREHTSVALHGHWPCWSLSEVQVVYPQKRAWELGQRGGEAEGDFVWVCWKRATFLAEAKERESEKEK